MFLYISIYFVHSLPNSKTKPFFLFFKEEKMNFQLKQSWGCTRTPLLSVGTLILACSMLAAGQSRAVVTCTDSDGEPNYHYPKL